MVFFLPPIIIGIIAALACGGKFSGLAYLRFRYGWAIVGAFVIQILIFSPMAVRLPENDLLVPALHILSNLVLVGAIALNWGTAGLRIVALGLLLNFLAIASNGGYMPVSGAALERVGRGAEIEEMEVNGHVSKAALVTESTRLPFLADIFAVDVPPIQGRVFSFGDVLIGIGAFWLVFKGMRKERPPRN